MRAKRDGSDPTSRSAETPLDGAVKSGSETTGSQLVRPMDVPQVGSWGSRAAVINDFT